MSDENERDEQEDQEAILVRRRTFLVTALLGIAVAEEACEEALAQPEPCLSRPFPRRPPVSDAAVRDATTDAETPVRDAGRPRTPPPQPPHPPPHVCLQPRRYNPSLPFKTRT